MSLQPGTRLSNYEVFSDVGRGGMVETSRSRFLPERHEKVLNPNDLSLCQCQIGDDVRTV